MSAFTKRRCTEAGNAEEYVILKRMTISEKDLKLIITCSLNNIFKHLPSDDKRDSVVVPVNEAQRLLTKHLKSQTVSCMDSSEKKSDYYSLFKVTHNEKSVDKFG